jgi:hypothetical protein
LAARFHPLLTQFLFARTGANAATRGRSSTRTGVGGPNMGPPKARPRSASGYERGGASAAERARRRERGGESASKRGERSGETR